MYFFVTYYIFLFRIFFTGTPMSNLLKKILVYKRINYFCSKSNIFVLYVYTYILLAQYLSTQSAGDIYESYVRILNEFLKSIFLKIESFPVFFFGSFNKILFSLFL